MFNLEAYDLPICVWRSYVHTSHFFRPDHTVTGDRVDIAP